MSECSLSSFTFPLSGSSTSESLESSLKKNACKFGLVDWFEFWPLTDFLPGFNLPLSSLSPKSFHILIQVERRMLAEILNSAKLCPRQLFPFDVYPTGHTKHKSRFCIFFLTKPIGIFYFYFRSLFSGTPINQKMP